MASEASRDIILSAIRESSVEAITEAAESAEVKQGATKPDTDAVVKKFAEMLEAVGGEAHVVKDADTFVEIIRNILREENDGGVLLSGNVELDKLAITEISKESGRELLKQGEHSLEQAASAGIGITPAEAGIADTGTIILRHTAEEGRLGALLPPTHIVVLRKSKIFPDKLTYLQYCRKEGTDLGQIPMTWVTGPSLTADIEKVLVRGAHGPKRVIALII